MKKFINLVALVASYVFVSACTTPNVDETNNNLSNEEKKEKILVIFSQVDPDMDGWSGVVSAEEGCELLVEELRAECYALFTNGEVHTVAAGLQLGDCDDADPQTYPGAPEICDGKDNDCDGQTDEGLGATCECTTDAQCVENYICSNDHRCIPEICDDGDLCTTDSRKANGECESTPIAGCCHNDAGCGTGKYCAGDTATAPGSCANIPACGDDKACTTDTFSLATESCVYTPITGCECETTSDCAANQRCTASHICEAVPCADDGDVCTKEEVIGHECRHTPITGCNQCTTDANCAGSVPANFTPVYPGGWWHLGNVSFGCLEGYCGSCVDADNDGACAECSVDADCRQGYTCEVAGSGAADKACVPVESDECEVNGDCDDGDPTNGTETCVSGTCHASTCTPTCSNKECGSDGCGGTCGVCDSGEACSAGQCVQGNTCTTDAQCDDSNAVTLDICFQGGCRHVAPGQCQPFAVRFAAASGSTGGPIEFFGPGSGGALRTLNSVQAGVHTSQVGECSAAVYNFNLANSRCITARGETPLKELLPSSPGVWGCVHNQQ